MSSNPSHRRLSNPVPEDRRRPPASARYCYIGPERGRSVPNTKLINHVTVLGHTTIGANNTIWSNAVIGADPQDLKYSGEPTRVVIGDGNQIREQVTIHPGTAAGGGVTRVGDGNLIMVGAHIAHDCRVGNHTVLANSVHLAGHVHVQDYVVMSGACAVHHFTTIGRCSFIGGLTRIVHDVPPFMIVEGNPSKVRGLNVVGLTRRNFAEDSIAKLKDAYRRLYRAASNGSPVTMSQRIQGLQDRYPDDPSIAELVSFLEGVNNGLHGRSREATRANTATPNAPPTPPRRAPGETPLR